MPSRYIALNHDTYGEVVDLTTGCQVSRHDLIRDAEAEAARLNAGAPKRAAPRTAFAPIDPRGLIAAPWIRNAPSFAWECVEMYAEFSSRADAEANGWRIARVRIEEIEDGE